MSHPFPHPFVAVRPEALAAAAGGLQGIGVQLAASNAEVAPATTAIEPAAADRVSVFNAAHFSAQGELYQAVAAHTTVIHEQFAAALAAHADSYADAEEANTAGIGSFAGRERIEGTEPRIDDFGSSDEDFDSSGDEYFEPRIEAVSNSSGSGSFGEDLGLDAAAPSSDDQQDAWTSDHGVWPWGFGGPVIRQAFVKSWLDRAGW